MPDLIPPHGGVGEPINRTVSDLGGPFAKSITLSDADLSSLYRIGDGALSPLTGPMTGEEWNRVLDEEVIVRGGKKYAWTIPIAFPVTDVLSTQETQSCCRVQVSAERQKIGTEFVRRHSHCQYARSVHIRVKITPISTQNTGGIIATVFER